MESLAQKSPFDPNRVFWWRYSLSSSSLPAGRRQRGPMGAAPAVLLATAAVLTLTGVAAAQRHSGRLRSTATVVAYAVVEEQTHVPSLVITNDDLTRGFVEIRHGTLLSVRSNSEAGLFLDFEIQSPFIDQVRIEGLPGNPRLGRHGGSIWTAGAGATPLQAALSYRFQLAPEAHVGRFPWPVTVAARVARRDLLPETSGLSGASDRRSFERRRPSQRQPSF